jgi:hypothetical protein
MIASAPQQLGTPDKPKKKKRIWQWAVIVFMLIGIAGGMNKDKSTDTVSANTSGPQVVETPSTQDQTEKAQPTESKGSGWYKVSEKAGPVIDLTLDDKNDEAYKLLNEDYDENDPDSVSVMGVLLADGIAVKQDLQKGLNLIKKGADAGSALGQVLLGRTYLFGLFGVPKDPKRGLEYVQKAIDQQYYYGFTTLADAYEVGALGPKNIEKAIDVYRQAEKLGSTSAKEQIERLSNLPDFVITAPALAKAYEDNEVAADEKFKGKVIQITAKIENIGKDIIDEPYITFSDGKQYSFRGIQCYFSKNEQSKIGSLKKGQTVTVQGICDGLMMNVGLKNCVFVDG